MPKSPKKAKVSVEKKTVKDLKVKSGKADAVKGGFTKPTGAVPRM